MDTDNKPIKLDLENVELSDTIKTKIYNEYDGILRLLEFHKKGSDLFRRWYVDSKLYFHVLIDEENPQKGITELRAIDPVKTSMLLASY